MGSKNNATIYLYFTLEGADLDFSLLKEKFAKHDLYFSPKGSWITKMHGGKSIPMERTLDFFQTKLHYSKIDMERFHKKAIQFISETFEGDPWIASLVRENNASIWCSVYPKYCMFGFEIKRELMRILLQFSLTIGYTITNPPYE